MVRILYHSVDVIDCTADPHFVDYDNIRAMLADVLKVLESDLVVGITSVDVYGHGDDDKLYKCDDYTDYNWRGNRKLAKGIEAEKHKVAGLYFYGDAEEELKDYPNMKILPPGLTGYKMLYDKIIKELTDVEKIGDIHIGVMWKFNMSHNCSDYIIIDFGAMTVDYSNQDWSAHNPDDTVGGYDPKYLEYLVDLGRMLGVTLQPMDL